MVTRNEDLWLTLAQAFLPPTAPAVADAFRTELPEDLLEIVDSLGGQAHKVVQAFRTSLDRFDDAQSLLRHYSALFLVPPVRARLNFAYHLDGRLNGRSQDALDATYAQFGVVRGERLADLPDHLSMMLEFLALLDRGEVDAAINVAAFAERFLTPALPRLCQEIEDAEQGDSPYLHLARLLELSLLPLVEVPPTRRPRGRRPIDPDRGEWQRCKVCGSAYASAKEIQLLTKALAEHGLPADHLDACPDCRNPARP